MLTNLMDKYDILICSLLNSKADVCIEDNAEAIEELVERASHHGVVPLLHYVMTSSEAWEDSPASIQESVSNTRKQAVAISMLREQFVASLFSVMSDAGIKPILLKGEALAHTHYTSPELRVRCDTDMLIPVTDIAKTIEVLEADGFTVSGGRSCYKSHQFTASKLMTNEISFQIDVHWRISNAPAFARLFSYEICFEKSKMIDVVGQECNVLHPSHALILACVHLSVQPDELADRLIWFYDIHLLVSAMTEVELLEMAQLATEKGVGNLCLNAIEKTQQCFELTIPQVVIELLQSTDEVKGVEGSFNKSYLALILADIKELTSLSQKWALVSELLFPGTPWLLNKYRKENPAWVPVLYVRYLGSGLFNRLTLR